MHAPLWAWVAFNLFILGLLALDLGVFHRRAHEVRAKEAAIWSTVWIGLALAFGGALALWRGPAVGLQFLTGYLIERSLSVDNIFVFVLVFSALAVPAALQHRVLFWGVLGALVLRGALIALGATLLATVHWVFYVFGAFLIATGVRMVLHRETEVHPGANPLVRLARRLLPITDGYEGQRFVVRRGARRWATPLLIALLLLESTDLLFALDSIPAIFAVTADPFLVYTSNVFAILGLRSLYFLLAGSVRRFRYLRFGLAAVLVFVGGKMLTSDLVLIPIAVSLAVIAVILLVTVAASLLAERGQRTAIPSTSDSPAAGADAVPAR